MTDLKISRVDAERFCMIGMTLGSRDTPEDWANQVTGPG